MRAPLASILLATLHLGAGCEASRLASDRVLNRDVEPDRIVLAEEISVYAKRASRTVLRSGTSWVRVGAINEGYVYATKDQVVVVNSFNVHEADIVLDGREIVGFFTKLEHQFIPARRSEVVFRRVDEE